MRSAIEGSKSDVPQPQLASSNFDAEALKDQILSWLDDAKAEEPVVIPLAGKSALADFMIIVSGRSDRHVGAIAEQLETKLKQSGQSDIRSEGKQSCDWVLVDIGDVVVHVFRPEVRDFYNLEKMWSADHQADDIAH